MAKVKIVVSGTLDVDGGDIKGLRASSAADKLVVLSGADDLRARVDLSKEAAKEVEDAAAQEAAEAERLISEAAVDLSGEAEAEAVRVMDAALTAEAEAPDSSDEEQGEGTAEEE